MEAIQQTTSLWELLNNNNGVLVPVFQRDYAQGRAEKIDLRKKFLEEIKEGLSSENGLLLDFVYGAKTDKEQIAPLDGQQRLTTIWLLMWYSLYRSYSVNKDQELLKKLEILKNFSYETRPSSTSFIKWLCGDDFFPKKEQEKKHKDKNKNQESEVLNVQTKEQVPINAPLSMYIQSLSGFHLLWKQDPTIQSILRMLSGTKKDGEDNNDGIEQVFNEEKNLKLLEKLLDFNPTIKFYYLDLNGIKQSDKLYVKMNARGEQLTGFENFKADFVGFLSKSKDLKVYTEIKDQNGNNNEKYILSKWDVVWNDMFWKHINLKEENGPKNQLLPIDDIFFSFIKRFLFNEYIVKKDKATDKDDKADKDNKVRALLYEGEQNEYTSFDTYKDLFSTETINKLIKVLDNAQKINEWIENYELPLLNSKGYSFFPEYQNKKNGNVFFDNNDKPVVSDISLQERVMMYGICQFLNCFVDDENVFKHWLRVLTNLVYYNEIASFDAFVSRIKFIDDVTKLLINNEKFDDIYNLAEAIGIGDNKTQLEQEIKKIKLINDNNDIEKELKNLEALWLFEGNIDFIFGADVDCSPSQTDLDRYAKVLKVIGEASHKKVGDNPGLTKLFQAVIAKWEDPEGNFELLINDEHNNLRKILNNELKKAFVDVLQDCNGIDKIIDNYKPDTTPCWKYGLIKSAALWEYTDKGKIVRDSSGYSLRKRIYKNEADINLEVYANFINNKANVENISYNENNIWTVKFEKSEQKGEYTNNEK